MTSRLNQQRLQIQIKVQNIPYRTVQIASRTCACSMLACLTLLSVTVWLAFPCSAGTFRAAAGATGAGDCKLRASLSLRLSITCSIPPASGDAELSKQQAIMRLNAGRLPSQVKKPRMAGLTGVDAIYACPVMQLILPLLMPPRACALHAATKPALRKSQVLVTPERGGTRNRRITGRIFRHVYLFVVVFRCCFPAPCPEKATVVNSLHLSRKLKQDPTPGGSKRGITGPMDQLGCTDPSGPRATASICVVSIACSNHQHGAPHRVAGCRARRHRPGRVALGPAQHTGRQEPDRKSVPVPQDHAGESRERPALEA